jgi:ubiquinone/menaquinone biosynthesis C-methylase UbiE
MDSDIETMRRRAWGEYWSTGRLHSCADGSGDNYDGAIGAFWRARFARVATGDRLLDLATGNGALPLLLQQLRGGTATVDAVDLAAVAPAWLDGEAKTGIRFHSGVRMEALPFASGIFDHVLSQFGIEYAERTGALSECIRVAKPEARFAFVMHHADSVLVRVGREELSHHAMLGASDGLIAAALDIMPLIARIRAGAAPTQDDVLVRNRYNQAMQALAGRIASSPAPDLLLEARDRVHRLVANAGKDAAMMDAQLQHYADALEGARLRTAEMVSHALDEARMDEFTRAFEALKPGMSVARFALRQAEGIVGWAWAADPASEAG